MPTSSAILMSSSSDGSRVRPVPSPLLELEAECETALRQAGEEFVGVGFELGDGRLR